MTGFLRPWRKMFTADPWVVVALVILTFLASLLAAVAPRAMSNVADRQFAQSVNSLTSYEREPRAEWSQLVEPASWGPKKTGPRWQSVIDAADEIRESQPDPLRTMLQPADYIARLSKPVSYVPDFESTKFYEVDVIAAISPTLSENMELVDGDWPAVSDAAPHEAVISQTVAERLSLRVGDELADHFKVTGIVRPVDPDGSRWEQFDAGNRVSVETDPNLGEKGRVWAYLASDSWGAMNQEAETPYTYQMWFPVSPEALPVDIDVPELGSQFTAFLATKYKVVPAEPPFPEVWAQFDSGLGSTLQRVVSEQRAATSLVAIVAAGPVGVMIALVILGAQLVVIRRRPHLELMVARGASYEQLRTLIGVEGALLALPAAILGHLATLAVPGREPWWAWLVTVVIGLAPAGALMLAIRGLGARTRADLTAHAGRWRIVAEIALIALAAAATWQLLTRPDNDSGIDLLAIATPILIALAAVILTLRLYPLPLTAIAGAFKRGRGATAFLGAARALRDPAGGWVPTLVVVLGTTVAMLSAVLLGTVTRGGETAVWDEIGGSARLDGRVTNDALDAIRDLDSVSAAGRVFQSGSDVQLVNGDETVNLRVWVIEDSMRDIWDKAPRITTPPSAVFDEGNVVVGGEVPEMRGSAKLDGHDVTIIGHLERIPGRQAHGAWALVSESTWAAMGQNLAISGTAHVLAADGADLDELRAKLETFVPYSRADTVAEGLKRNQEAVVGQALQFTLVSAAIGTVVLTALAIVVVQLMGARSRQELLAILRTQGMRPGQARGVVAWEVGPAAVTALVVGALLGVGIAWLLVRAVDLTGLTGGTSAPSLHLDPLLLGATMLAVVATVTLAITVSAWAAGRTNLAQALRIGEER